jgi:hypothetical protein
MRKCPWVTGLLPLCFFLCATAFADSIAPPPGVNLCTQYNICGTPTTIEVLVGGVGTSTWTDVIELSTVYQPGVFCFSDGTCLPPDSIWARFLYPNRSVGLSSPLTWRPDPPDSSTAVPEPSTVLLLVAGLASLIPIVLRGHPTKSRV